MTSLFVCSLLMAFAFDVSFGHESSPAARIYNGLKANKSQLPYQVLLVQETKDDTSEFCGGSLISVKHVLTAAHCFNNAHESKVYFGVVDTKDGDGVSYTIINMEHIVLHPEYNATNFENDVAIINLPTEIVLSDKIQTIALPKAGWAAASTFDNYQVTISGWGQTHNGEHNIHQFLQFQRVYVMPHKECVSSLSSLLPVTEGMICTEKSKVPSGPCHGDSGGPLTVRLRSGLYVIGIVSWGAGLCSGPEPIVYTNVGHYLSWISSQSSLELQ